MPKSNAICFSRTTSACFSGTKCAGKAVDLAVTVLIWVYCAGQEAEGAARALVAEIEGLLGQSLAEYLDQ